MCLKIVIFLAIGMVGIRCVYLFLGMICEEEKCVKSEESSRFTRRIETDLIQ